MNTSLKGLRILNTRPQKQATALSKHIVAAGGISIECPTIKIIETAKTWIEHLPALETINVAIFISPNAAFYAINALSHRQMKWPDHIKTIAIGSGTANVLESLHVKVADIPKTADSESLIQLPDFHKHDKLNLLLFKGVGGRELIAHQLLAMGHHIESIEVYERTLPKYNPDAIKSIWQDDQVDIILLTSEQSIRNLFTMFGPDALSWLQQKTCLVISNRLAKIAEEYGIKRVIVCAPDSILKTLTTL